MVLNRSVYVNGTRGQMYAVGEQLALVSVHGTRGLRLVLLADVEWSE